MTSKYVAFSVVTILFASVMSVGMQTSLHATELLPDITLTVPENKDYRDYLGLGGTPGEEFRLAEIDGDILLIELFSMYCPYCQAAAPKVNEFHTLARQQEEKGITIKVVGLGASNTQFEVEYFRDTYGIEFPLFPDKTLAMYKKLGGEGTPGFIGCLLGNKGEPVVVLRESGGFESPEGFLAQLLEKAGYK